VGAHLVRAAGRRVGGDGPGAQLDDGLALAELTALAEDRGLPVSTIARQLLLQSLAPADDLKTALDRLERDGRASWRSPAAVAASVDEPPAE
jgi:hypothetical protein